MTTQPKALQLAEVFETYAVDHQPDGWPAIRQEVLNSAAAELRRLHAENEALRAAVEQPGVHRLIYPGGGKELSEKLWHLTFNCVTSHSGNVVHTNKLPMREMRAFIDQLCVLVDSPPPPQPAQQAGKVLLTDDYGKPEGMSHEGWRQLTQVIPFRLREVMKGHLYSIDVLHESLNRVADGCLEGFGWRMPKWQSTAQPGVAISITQAQQPDARTAAIQACIDRLEQGGKPAEAGMLRHHFAKDMGEE